MTESSDNFWNEQQQQQTESAVVEQQQQQNLNDQQQQAAATTDTATAQQQQQTVVGSNDQQQQRATNGEAAAAAVAAATVSKTAVTTADAQMTDDADLLELKQRVKGMDEEAARLIQLQTEMEQQIMKSTASPTPAGFGAAFGSVPMSAEEKMEADSRSIYVGNVDYSATAQELENHFHGCGSINRVTILCDKFSGHPKGFAYVEFGDKDSVQTAMALDDSLFKGRQIKVVSKRTNRPGISTTDRLPGGRGRGGASAAVAGGIIPTGYGGFMAAGGRGRGAAGAFGVSPGRGAAAGFSPYMRSMRGRVVKGGRGFYHYAPY